MARNVEEIVMAAKDEASAVIARVAGNLGGLGAVLGRLGTALGPVGLGLGALATGAGAIAATGARMADTVEQLDLLAARTGVSIENLQVFQRVITEAGGNSDSLTTALTFLNRSIAQGDPLLKKLGIEGMNTFDTFMALSRIFAESGDEAAKTEIAYQLLGRGSAELVAIMPKLVGLFSDMDKELRKIGGLITGETAKAARNLDASMDALGRSVDAAMTRMKSAAIPWAQQMVDAFNKVFAASKGPAVTLTDTDERIARTQREIADLEKQIKTAKESQDPVNLLTFFEIDLTKAKSDLRELLKLREDLMTGAQRAAQREGILGTTGTAAAANLRALLGKPDDISKERAERLAELRRILVGTGLDAVKVLDTLNAIADAKAKTEIEKLFFIGPQTTKEIDEVNARIERSVELLTLEKREVLDLMDAQRVKADNEERARLQAELGLVKPPFVGPMEDPERRTPQTVRDAWESALADIISSAGLAEAALAAVFNGLESGFRDAFTQIAAGTATLGRVLQSLWHGIVDAIISELSRVAAALVALGVVNFLTGGLARTFTPFQMPGLEGRLTSGGETFSMNPPSAFGMQPAPTVNIYSYDLRDGVRELRSLTGGMRLAQTKLDYLGEY